jgi:hypothetical protein
LLRSASHPSQSGVLVIFLYFVQTAALEVLPVGKWLSWYQVVNLGLHSLSGGTVNNSGAGEAHGGAGGTSQCVAPIPPEDQMLLAVLLPLWLMAEMLFVALVQWTCIKIGVGRWLANKCRSIPAAAGGIRRIGHRALSLLAGCFDSFRSSVYIGGTFATLLFCYTSVSSAALSWLLCVSVSDGRSVLFRYPSIDCDSEAYRSRFVLAIVVLVAFTAGFPIGIVAWLWQKQNKVKQAYTQQREEAPPVVRPLSHSVAVHPDEEASAAAVSSSLSPAAVDSSSSAAAVVAPSSAANDAAAAPVPSAPSSPMSNFLLRYGTLFVVFDERAWYWQCVVLLRRALFVMADALLVMEPAYKYAAFGALHVLFLQLQSLVAPFTSRALNAAELSSQVALLLVTLLLLCPTPYGVGVQAVLLLILIVFPLALLSLWLARHWTTLHKFVRVVQKRVRPFLLRTNHGKNKDHPHTSDDLFELDFDEDIVGGGRERATAVLAAEEFVESPLRRASSVATGATRADEEDGTYKSVVRLSSPSHASDIELAQYPHRAAAAVRVSVHCRPDSEEPADPAPTAPPRDEKASN